MLGKPGATIPLLSTTADPATGGGLDPSTLTWIIRRNGIDITLSSFVSTNTDIGAGITSASFVIPSNSVEGDQIQVIETATVSSITASSVNCRLTVVTAFPGEIYARLGAPAGASIAADVVLRKPFDYPLTSSPITYNANGDIQTVHFASGKIHTYSYNGSFKLLGITES
jgi:YD repeat-containing protein